MAAFSLNARSSPQRRFFRSVDLACASPMSMRPGKAASAAGYPSSTSTSSTALPNYGSYPAYHDHAQEEQQQHQPTPHHALGDAHTSSVKLDMASEADQRIQQYRAGASFKVGAHLTDQTERESVCVCVGLTFTNRPTRDEPAAVGHVGRVSQRLGALRSHLLSVRRLSVLGHSTSQSSGVRGFGKHSSVTLTSLTLAAFLALQIRRSPLR